MRRVSKGKLAGKVGPKEQDLGWSSLAPQEHSLLARAALSALSDAFVLISEDGKIKACSESLLGFTGMESAEVVGMPFKSLGDGDDESSRLAIALLEAEREGGGNVAVKLKSFKSRAIPAKVKLISMGDAAEGRSWLATMSVWIDGERREADKFLSMPSSEFDSSTGLLGRMAFLRAAAVAYNRDGFKDRPCLVCLDLDRFGDFNAKHGSEKGDEAIAELANRIKGQLRRGDWAGRMGSDEFCVYASFAGNPADAAAVASRLLNAIGQPCEVSGALEVVTASMGVSIGPANGATIDELVVSAERAMKKAKESGYGLINFA